MDNKKQPCERCGKDTVLTQLNAALEYCQVENGHALKGVYVCNPCKEYLSPLPYEDSCNPIEGVFYIYIQPTPDNIEPVSASE